MQSEDVHGLRLQRPDSTLRNILLVIWAWLALIVAISLPPVQLLALFLSPLLLGLVDARSQRCQP